MRIVYTVLNGRMAGGQMICLQIMLAVRQEGHEVCLVTPSLGELTDVLERLAIPVFRIPMERTFHFHQAWQFARFLRAWQADLVHCHAFVAGSILARLGSTLAGVPIICHAHAHPNFNHNPVIRSAQVWLDNATAHLATLVAVSQSVKSSLVQQGIPTSKVRVILNGVQVREEDDALDRSHSLQALGLPSNDEVSIGYVGRLSEQKGLHDLLCAAQAVVTECSRARFLIVGEDHETGGQYRRILQEMAEQLSLDGRVQFVGFQTDVARLMYAFDIFVLPSWIEGMPVTILEAMAAGKPVVATSVGGVPELVVDGETGLLVPPRDPDHLAEALIFLLENPDLARRMGEAGGRRVRENFSQQMMLDQIMAVYEEAVRKSRRRPSAVDGYDANRH